MEHCVCVGAAFTFTPYTTPELTRLLTSQVPERRARWLGRAASSRQGQIAYDALRAPIEADLTLAELVISAAHDRPNAKAATGWLSHHRSARLGPTHSDLPVLTLRPCHGDTALIGRERPVL